MNGIAKIVSPLLLASFLFSHCEFFSIASRYLTKPINQTGGVCVNPDCCCDHDGPEGKQSMCGMCTTPLTTPNVMANDQCCLYQANCDPKSGLPVLAVNKDIRPLTTVNRIFNFAAVDILRPSEIQISSFDFKAAIFHPPQG